MYRLYICSPNTEPSQARRVCLTTVSFRLLHTIDGQALVGKEHRAGYSLFNTHSSPRVGDLNWKILEISCKEGLKLKMEQLRVIHFGWRLTLGSVGANKWSTMFKCALGTLLSGSWTQCSSYAWSVNHTYAVAFEAALLRRPCSLAPSELLVINAYRPMSKKHFTIAPSAGLTGSPCPNISW